MVTYDVLDRLRKAASDAPYRIKAGGRGVIVWEITDGRWQEVATFRHRVDAETFVFAMADPVLGQWR